MPKGNYDAYETGMRNDASKKFKYENPVTGKGAKGKGSGKKKMGKGKKATMAGTEKYWDGMKNEESSNYSKENPSKKGGKKKNNPMSY